MTSGCVPVGFHKQAHSWPDFRCFQLPSALGISGKLRPKPEPELTPETAPGPVLRLQPGPT